MERYSGLTPEQIQENETDDCSFYPWNDDKLWDQFPFKPIDEQDQSVTDPSQLGWTGPD